MDYQECKPVRETINKCASQSLFPQLCRKEIPKRKRQRKTWDEEMTELFCEFKPIRVRSPGMIVPLSEKQPRLFRIWDISQKFFFLINNMLIATHNSGSTDQLMAVVPNNSLDPAYQPIFMGLSDRMLTLNCVQQNGGQPQLQLAEKAVMDLYKSDEEFKSFTFYSKTDGNDDTCSFESAAFPGWFISTSSEPDQPIGLSQQGGSDITLFYFEREESL